MGQGYHAANHLVCFAGIDTQADVDVQGCIELGESHFFHQSAASSRV